MKKSIKCKRQANDQVNRSSSFLQSILDALSAHVAVVDDQGCIVGINEAWRHFAELNGMSWDDWGIGSNYIETCEKAVGPCSEEAGDVAQGIRLVLSGKIKAYRTEYPCHSPDEKRWFQVRVTGFEDREGMKVVAAHESVTELKVAMERIRVSEELFRAVFESAQDLIAVKDRDFVYTKINPAFEKLVGLPVREVLGRRAEDIFGEEAGRHIRELDTRVLAGQTVEEEFTRPVNGIPMTFHDTRVPLLNAEGRTIGI